MWMMLQKDNPEDYVIGTGEKHSVEEFLTIAFNHVGLNFKDYLKIDKRFFRPAEVDTLLADISNSKKKLGWMPKISFEELVKEMVESDLKNIKDKIY
jgi:GDPmannose 4,6-dehydratase